MTSSEKILAGILEQANATADGIIKKAETDAAAVIAEKKVDAQKNADQMIADAQKKAGVILSSGESSAALIKRDAALKFRREKIEDILALANDRVNAFDDEAYFDFLSTIARKNARDELGELFLCERDLKRNIKLFEDKLSGLNLKISATPAEISGGFILKYGHIEINAQLESLIYEKRDELVECVNKALFM